MAARGQQLPLQGAAILSAPASKEYRRRRLQGQLDKETIWGSAWFGEHDSGQHAGEEEEGVDWYPYAPGYAAATHTADWGTWFWPRAEESLSTG